MCAVFCQLYFKEAVFQNVNYISIKKANQVTEKSMGYDQPHAKDQEDEIKNDL